MISTEFEFDITQLKGKEGFIEEAAKIAEAKKWAQDNVGQDCEYRAIKMLETILSNEVATIISGYKEQCLADIVKCLNMKISDSEFDALVILKVCRIMCLLKKLSGNFLGQQSSPSSRSEGC